MSNLTFLQNQLLSQVSEARVTELAAELIRRPNDCETGDFIADFLQSCGIAAEKQPCGEGRFNIIGRIPGTAAQAEGNLYIGHIDTVPDGNANSWSSPPRCPRLQDGRLYGRGAADMKGSLAAMLHAAELLARLPTLPKGMTMLFDADEECHNLGMKRLLQEPVQGSFAIVGEPSSMSIALGHRGVMAFEAVFAGKSAHAARPNLGVNAISQALQFCREAENLNRLLTSRAPSPLGTGLLTVTMISGGTQVNVVPDRCTVRLDRRLIQSETPKQAEEELVQLLKPFPGASLTVTTCCPPCLTSSEHPSVRQLSKVMSAVGQTACCSIFPATCEAGMFTGQTGIPAVILWPGSIEQAHQADEYIRTGELLSAAQAYLLFFSGSMTVSADGKDVL